MKKLDYLECDGRWNVLFFGGFSEIIAEFTFKDPIDIGRLLNNEDFRKVTLKLRSEFVINTRAGSFVARNGLMKPDGFRL
jgi:hypothetical protein